MLAAAQALKKREKTSYDGRGGDRSRVSYLHGDQSVREGINQGAGISNL